jgi:VanZ family protein
MCVIFYLSNQPAEDSTQLSDSVLSKIEFLGISVSELFIRKTAHVCEYILLAFLLSNTFYNFSVKHWYLFSPFIASLYACSDEIHQLFIPGRSGEVLDVIIDTSGAILGVLIYLSLLKIIKSVRRRKNVRNSSV